MWYEAMFGLAGLLIGGLGGWWGWIDRPGWAVPRVRWMQPGPGSSCVVWVGGLAQPLALAGLALLGERICRL